MGENERFSEVGGSQGRNPLRLILRKPCLEGELLVPFRFFCGPRIDSNGSAFTVDRETEVRVPGFTKDREVSMEHIWVFRRIVRLKLEFRAFR
eukprot:5989984-Amphidinium_carterae.1